jgi:hypothetical protein
MTRKIPTGPLQTLVRRRCDSQRCESDHRQRHHGQDEHHNPRPIPETPDSDLDEVGNVNDPWTNCASDRAVEPSNDRSNNDHAEKGEHAYLVFFGPRESFVRSVVNFTLTGRANGHPVSMASVSG